MEVSEFTHRLIFFKRHLEAGVGCAKAFKSLVFSSGRQRVIFTFLIDDNFPSSIDPIDFEQTG